MVAPLGGKRNTLRGGKVKKLRIPTWEGALTVRKKRGGDCKVGKLRPMGEEKSHTFSTSKRECVDEPDSLRGGKKKRG